MASRSADGLDAGEDAVGLVRRIALMLATPRGRVLAIFVLSFAVSAFFNVFVMGINHGQEADGLMYHRLARDPWMFITSWQESRQPLFPLLLGLLHMLAGESAFLPLARFVLSGIGALNCVLLYFLGRRLVGERVALLAGLGGALYPNLFLWSAFLLTETPSIAVLLGTLLLLLRWQERPTLSRAAFAGAFLGLTVLTRASLQFFAPFVVLWLAVILWRRWGMLARTAAVLIFAAVIVVAPWTARNYLVLGRFVPVALNGGTGLYGGNNPLSLAQQPRINLGHWDGDAANTLHPECLSMAAVDRDAYLRGKAVSWIVDTIRNRPMDFVRLEGWKMREAWFPRILDRDSRSKQVFAFLFVVVSCLSIAGMLTSFRRWKELLLLYLMVVAHTAQTLVFFGDMHYRASYEPALLLFSALFVSQVGTAILGECKRGQARGTAPAHPVEEH